MANEVYANGREFSCKAGEGKSICAFPDVCFTPPENPATPPGVPIPYPNTGMTTDTTDGSKTVKITNKEVMLKNKSYFKKSTGDEAGCAAKKGVVTSVHRGKVYFIAWSMDVKIEGENAVRHLDLTTHNHASTPPNCPPIAFADRMALINESDHCAKDRRSIEIHCNPPEERAKCPDTRGVDEAKNKLRKLNKKKQAREAKGKKETKASKKKRKDAQEVLDLAHQQYSGQVRDNDCLRALQCALASFDAADKGACCPPQTPEHLIPASQFGAGRGKGHATYKQGQAPCVCAEGGKSAATHGVIGQERRAYMDRNGIPQSEDPVWTVNASAKCGAHAAKKANPHCSERCLEEQILNGHRKMGVNDGDKISGKQENVLKSTAGTRAELFLDE